MNKSGRTRADRMACPDAVHLINSLSGSLLACPPGSRNGVCSKARLPEGDFEGLWRPLPRNWRDTARCRDGAYPGGTSKTARLPHRTEAAASDRTGKWPSFRPSRHALRGFASDDLHFLFGEPI